MTKDSGRNIVCAACIVVVAIAISSSPARAAIEPRSILKTFFETGDVPTEDQFGDVFDSYIHQTDDGLTLVGIGLIPDGTARGIAIRTGGNVGINELLPDTFAGDWGGPFASPSNLNLPQMCANFCGTSGYLPLKYESADGTAHYGFLRVSMENDPGVSPGPAIFVHGWAWESSANTTITTFAVPEPTVAAMLIVALPLAFARRRRAG